MRVGPIVGAAVICAAGLSIGHAVVEANASAKPVLPVVEMSQLRGHFYLQLNANDQGGANDIYVCHMVKGVQYPFMDCSFEFHK